MVEGTRDAKGSAFEGIVGTAALLSLLAVLLVGCDRGAADEGAGMVLKAPIVMEMRTILRDVRVAQERAATETGGYVEGSELRTHLDRAVPENYTLEVSAVSADGYRARVVHGLSGHACELEVSPGGSTGPECD